MEGLGGCRSDADEEHQREEEKEEEAAVRGDTEIRVMEENGAKRCLGGKCDKKTTGLSPRSGFAPYQTRARGTQAVCENNLRRERGAQRDSGGTTNTAVAPAADLA